MAIRGRAGKEVSLDKFLNIKKLVDMNIMCKKDACSTLNISMYMYNKYAETYKNIKLEDLN